jgi:hypothetical protein
VISPWKEIWWWNKSGDMGNQAAGGRPDQPAQTEIRVLKDVVTLETCLNGRGLQGHNQPVDILFAN